MKTHIVGLTAALLLSGAISARADTITINGRLDWDSDSHDHAFLIFSSGPFGLSSSSQLLLDVTIPFPWGPYSMGTTAAITTNASNFVFRQGTINGLAYQSGQVVATGDFSFATDPVTVPSVAGSTAFQLPVTASGSLNLTSTTGEALFDVC